MGLWIAARLHWPLPWLSLSLCFSVEREMGGRARWLDCLVRSHEMRGGSDMLYEWIGLFLFFGLLGSEEDKRVEGLGLGLGLGLK